MTTLDALLRAILADPADDLPRLQLADLLEERNGLGDAARADYIRVQLLIAQEFPDGTACLLTPGFNHGAGRFVKRCRCRPCSLRRREWEIWRHHGCDWGIEVLRPFVEADLAEALRTGRPIRPDYMEPAPSFTWRRGVVHSLTITAADFLAHAASVFSAQPVEAVTLTGKRPSRIGSGIIGWHRHVLPDGPAEDELPSELFDRLPAAIGGGNSWGTTGGVESAQRHLSAAAVAHGRAAAGLPALAPA